MPSSGSLRGLVAFGPCLLSLCASGLVTQAPTMQIASSKSKTSCTADSFSTYFALKIVHCSCGKRNKSVPNFCKDRRKLINRPHSTLRFLNVASRVRSFWCQQGLSCASPQNDVLIRTESYGTIAQTFESGILIFTLLLGLRSCKIIPCNEGSTSISVRLSAVQPRQVYRSLREIQATKRGNFHRFIGEEERTRVYTTQPASCKC